MPQVHDNGKFFDAETITKANAMIKRIEEKYKKDVVVETFAEIPLHVKTKFNYSPETREAFYHKWRDYLAEQAGVNGVIVIICKDNGNTQSRSPPVERHSKEISCFTTLKAEGHLGCRLRKES